MRQKKDDANFCHVQNVLARTAILFSFLIMHRRYTCNPFGGRTCYYVPYINDIKLAFLRRTDARSRQEVDARNSENR
jgi:hypothetical protein